MPYKEILLTRRLFLLRMKIMKKYQTELNIRDKPEINQSHLKILNKSIENNTIYCKICGEKIDETYIGKTIVVNKNSTRFRKSWRHVECAQQKNMIIMNITTTR